MFLAVVDQIMAPRRTLDRLIQWERVKYNPILGLKPRSSLFEWRGSCDRNALERNWAWRIDNDKTL